MTDPNPADAPHDDAYAGVDGWDDDEDNEDAEDWPTEEEPYEDDDEDDAPDDDEGPYLPPAAAGDYEPANVPEPATEASRASRQAAKYRTELRETRAALADAGERLAAYEWAQVEQIAEAGRMASPADFRLVHGNLDALRGDDGTLDVAKVTAAVETLLDERPHWRARPKMARNPAQGAGGRSVPLPAKSWADAIQQR